MLARGLIGSLLGMGLLGGCWLFSRRLSAEIDLIWGDHPFLNAEMRTGRRNSGGVGGNGQSGPSYDARTRHGESL